MSFFSHLDFVIGRLLFTTLFISMGAKQTDIIFFYGRYYIADFKQDRFYMLQVEKRQIQVIDRMKFDIISLLAELRDDLKDLLK